MVLAVTGGQAEAHAPEQVDVLLLSPMNRYRARPCPSARNFPSIPEADRRSIVVAAMSDDALAAAAGLLGWAVADDATGAWVLPFELRLLEQAVAARAIPAAMTAAEIVFLIGCSLVVTRVRSIIPRRPDASGPYPGPRAPRRSGSAGYLRKDTD
jgi:hypothetical protein